MDSTSHSNISVYFNGYLSFLLFNLGSSQGYMEGEMSEVSADWLDEVLQHYKEYIIGVYQGIGDYDEATAKAAILSHMREARIDELKKVIKIYSEQHKAKQEVIAVHDEIPKGSTLAMVPVVHINDRIAALKEKA